MYITSKHKTKNFLFLFLALILLGCGKDTTKEDSPESSIGDVHLRGVGDSANELLSNNTFKKIVFDMVYVKGYKPTDDAIADFSEFVLERTFKEAPEFKFTEIPPQNQESYSIDDIVNIEKKYRTKFNSEDTIAVFVFFSDAEAETDKENNGITLGVAFRNTSMAIYEAKIKSLTTNLSFVSTLESATLQHELGHLFGLVNNGAAMLTPHENVTGGHHCNNTSCLMTSVIEFTTPAKILSRLSKNDQIPTLDANCIDDLRAIGGK